MRIFPVVVKKVTQIVSGAATNFISAAVTGFRATAVLTARVERVISGFAVLGSPAALVSAARAGLRLTTAITASMAPSVRGGFRGANRSSGTAKPPGLAGLKMTQVSYTLNGLYGANAVVEEATVGNAWQSDPNAAGKHNGSSATLAGDVLNAQAGRLVLSYADFPNKSLLTITAVKLEFYVRSSGTVLDSGDLRLQWRRSGLDPWTTLETISGNVDALTTPRIFDVTAGVSGWTDLDNIQTAVFAHADAAENLIQYQADAVELRISAGRTDTL